jgi:outer membrane protein
MKKIVVTLACALLSCGAVIAQTSPKIGWIESAELLQSMPEKSKADTDIAKYAKDFQSQIDIMMKEYQTKGQQYQANEKTMTDAIKEVKQREIADLQNRIESTQQSAQEKLQQKKQDIYAPILDKADKAIKAVAKEKNYDYIIDKSGGALLYGKDSENILPLVKAKLGIK